MVVGSGTKGEERHRGQGHVARRLELRGVLDVLEDGPGEHHAGRDGLGELFEVRDLDVLGLESGFEFLEGH